MCDFENINFNPPLKISEFLVKDNIEVNVIDDGVLLGGTKQRAILKFINHYDKYDEFVYAGPATGFAQVALTMACVKLRKTATLFIVNHLNYDPRLTFWCQKMGANIFMYYGKLEIAQKEADNYVNSKKETTFLIPFGLKDPVYANFLEEELLKVIPRELNPKRLWLAVGSGTLLRVLAKIWKNTEFYPVKVGRNLWEDQYKPEVWKRMGGKERIEKLQYPENFFVTVPNFMLPPYQSVDNYDAKVWPQVYQFGKNGDYIWNVASDYEISRCDFDVRLNYNLPYFDSLKKELYNIKSSDYVSNKSDEQKLIEAGRKLIPLVRNNIIWFPFRKFFLTDPRKLFNNLKQINLAVKHDEYQLKSYFPPNKFYLPPIFRNKITSIVNNKGDYQDTDIITDYYTENIRLKSKRYNQEYSILQCWETDNCLERILALALKNKNITPAILRDVIYNGITETGTFSVTRARSLIKLVLGTNTNDKKWLDISSGWGDRLITAISLEMIYTGYDPNIELKAGHDRMIEDFGDSTKQKIYYEPFEKADIEGGPYDVIMTSPPFFDVEKYSSGQQSINTYPEFNNWVVNFLFASLLKAWDNLKQGGFLILHLGDTKLLKVCELTNIFIENNLSGASWEGVIGISGESANYRPVWCYKKLSRYEKLNRWKNKTQTPRTLYYYYPEIQKLLIIFYAKKFIDDNFNYELNIENVSSIKSKLLEYYTNLPNDLFDDLTLSSIIYELGADDTIKWCVAMIKISFFPQ